MRFLLLAPALALALAVMAAEGTAYKSAVVVKADAVTAGFAKGATIVNGGDFLVQTSRREKPGGPEAHTNQDEVTYVVSGSATLVTGGTITGLREGKNGNVSGSGVEGGVEQKIGKGDVIGSKGYAALVQRDSRADQLLRSKSQPLRRVGQ
jgi:hypothetical protein